jgi:PBSX family phage terminase large subunit
MEKKQNAENSDTPIKLSLDELAMVNAYFECNMNATRAYMKLHPKASYDSARTTASDMLTKPNIKGEITRRLNVGAMPGNEVIYRLGAMARAEMFPFIRIGDDGFVYFNFSDPQAEAYMFLIKKLKTKRERRVEGQGEDAEEWEGEWVEVELHDSQRALELMGKFYKMFGDKEEKPDGNNAVSVLPSIPAEFLAGVYLDVYRDIINHKYKEFPFGDGRGSAKSTFVGGWVIPYLIVNNPQVHCLALRQKAKDLRGSVYAQIMWGINMLGLREQFKPNVSPMEITYIPTGQKIYFSGADDPGSLKSIKPPFGYLGILWFEEFDQFRGEEAVRNILQSALRGGDTTWMFETWNTPKSIQSWVNQWTLVPKEGRRPVHKCSYLDIPKEWLGQTFIDEAEHLKTANPKAYEHEYMGIATGTGGQVFENLEIREITDEEIAKFDNLKEGIDWGFSPDPFVWGRYHYDAKHLTIYVIDEFFQHKLRNEQAYAKLTETKKITPEQLIVADSSEDKSVMDFRAYGANIRGAEKGPGSVKYSYKWLQSRVKIVMDPKRSPNHVREFVNCEHEQMKDGTFIGEYPDHDNHCIDTMRYAHNLEWRQRGK